MGAAVKPRKWEREVTEALVAAGRPLRAGEITQAILGMPHPSWTSLQQAMQNMARRGMLVRVGKAVGGPDPYRYALPEMRT